MSSTSALICPECGVPLVPFGGEDVCLAYCDECDRHDCECGWPEDLDREDEENA